MILDRLENAGLYDGLAPGISRALEYLRQTDFEQIEPGRYQLDGERLVAIVQRYRTKPLSEAVWESHRRYIDVQYVAGGVERFGYAHLSTQPVVRQPYLDERDVIFYEPQRDLLEAPAGTFLIFFPHDVHAPGIAVVEPLEVLKVVVKVAMEGGV